MQLCLPTVSESFTGNTQVVNEQTSINPDQSYECSCPTPCLVSESPIMPGDGSEHPSHMDPSQPVAVSSVDGAKKKSADQVGKAVPTPWFNYFSPLFCQSCYL